MNPVQWVFFIGTVVVSLGFSFHGLWVFLKYKVPAYRTSVTGCEIARYVLDQAGLFQIPVTPLERNEESSASDGLFLPPNIYEGRDFLSILKAARQAFLKSQLSNTMFWVRLKQRMAFVIRFTVSTGWILFAIGYFFPLVSFLINLGLGCFTVVMGIAIFDTPFELEVEDKMQQLLKQSGYFQVNEAMHLRKLSRAIALLGLSSIVRAPFNRCLCIFGKEGWRYGI